MTYLVDFKHLAHFLVKAKILTYASGNDEYAVTPILKNSHQLEYKEDELRYCDIYYGGLHFIGMETVFHIEKPIWGMSYYGGVLPGSNDSQITGMPAVLKAALRQVPLDAAFRGPPSFRMDNYLYENEVYGDMKLFHGVEIIRFQERAIYQLHYSGGIVD
jgi:hypothetical protein